MPALSFAPAVIVAVYVVEYARLLDGVNVAVVPVYVTVPVTPLFKVNVAVLTVDAVIVSLNVAVIAEFTATFVALLAGLTDVTVGGVVSAVVPVVNVHVLLAVIALPAASFTLVVMVAVYAVE